MICNPYPSSMEEQKNSGEGNQQGRDAPIKVWAPILKVWKAWAPILLVWAPIVISVLALVISTLDFKVQERALNQQREEIIALNGQLEIQKNQLDIQRDALETQEKEFQATADRWIRDGPLFTARGYLRQNPELAIALLDFSEDRSENQSDQELKHVHMYEGQAKQGPTLIEAEVTNVGRAPGQITGVTGKLEGYSSGSSLPGTWPCLTYAAGKMGESWPTVCSADFAEEDVICLGPDSIEAVCQFPLQVPQESSIRLRFKLNSYFAENLMCNEGGPRGRVEVKIRPATGPHLKSAFFASNWRGCPEGPGTLRLLSPVPFK